MIGHYLNNLTPEGEERVLSLPLQPGGIERGCLIARGDDIKSLGQPTRHYLFWPPFYAGGSNWGNTPYVGKRYDDLYRRFKERLNVAIRNRILSNRARRALQEVPHDQPCGR